MKIKREKLKIRKKKEEYLYYIKNGEKALTNALIKKNLKGERKKEEQYIKNGEKGLKK